MKGQCSKFKGKEKRLRNAKSVREEDVIAIMYFDKSVWYKNVIAIFQNRGLGVDNIKGFAITIAMVSENNKEGSDFNVFGDFLIINGSAKAEGLSQSK